MGIASHQNSASRNSKTFSHSEPYFHEDSISLPDGNMTPPEGALSGGVNGTHKPIPLSQNQNGAPPDASPEILGHGSLVLSRWHRFLDVITGEADNLLVDGKSLDLATILAVSRYGVEVAVAEPVSPDMARSSDFLKRQLAEGHVIYGVNTGFGGSANTHTDKVAKLQRNLISFLNCGIIPSQKSNDILIHDGINGTENKSLIGPHSRHFAKALVNEDPMATSVMPESWVRGTLLIRCNSLASGNSGVRSALAHGLIDMLVHHITPVIPLRGSISASGDLIPLSYVAGALHGSPGVSVWIDDSNGGRQQVSADVALAKYGQTPLQFGPKEGLAIVNGTAVSASVGALALIDAHGLLVLSQVLTAMGVEALRGSAESFDPFFSTIRPHPGQTEVARNIDRFLHGSQLVSDDDHDYENSDTLRQDRYSIRTTPQWIGPQLENLMLADKQINVEINSTTDNPIVDTNNEKILHGGNFQAMSVTSAMEKIRSSLQVIGRMLFSQCTELINPSFNNGLPPNLTADEPSQNYLLKGIDINIASLQAELGFLAQPVTPHVQNAEMGNQSLNSLALLSARYTHTALNVLSQLSAAYLLTLCQALDLRAMYALFLSSLEPQFLKATSNILSPFLGDVGSLHNQLWLQFKREIGRTTGIDSTDRFTQIIKSLQPILFESICLSPKHSQSGNVIDALQTWTKELSEISFDTFHDTRAIYAAEPTAAKILGPASRRMYEFVRGPLGVPFQMAFSHHRDPGHVRTMNVNNDDTTIGMEAAKIHTAIMSGALYVPVMECMREVEEESSNQA